MLSEISQTEKDKFCMISLICGTLKKKKQLKETDNRLVVSKSQVGEVQGEGIIYSLLMMVSIPTFLF